MLSSKLPPSCSDLPLEVASILGEGCIEVLTVLSGMSLSTPAAYTEG